MTIYDTTPRDFRIDDEIHTMFYLPKALTFWHSVMASENIDTMGIMQEYVQKMNKLFSANKPKDNYIYDIGFQINFKEVKDNIIQTFKLKLVTDKGIIILQEETETKSREVAIKEYMALHAWLIDTDYEYITKYNTGGNQHENY